MLISESYRKELQGLHKKDEDWGTGPRGSIINICHWLYMNKVKQILDYGCGKGVLGHYLPITVSYYDPAVEEYSGDPRPQDYLLCTDVLEHIEPECIENVIKHIVSKFNKKAYVIISLTEASTTLPSGRNAHLIIKSATWWMDLIKKYAFIEQVQYMENLEGAGHTYKNIILSLRKIRT